MRRCHLPSQRACLPAMNHSPEQRLRHGRDRSGVSPLQGNVWHSSNQGLAWETSRWTPSGTKLTWGWGAARTPKPCFSSAFAPTLLRPFASPKPCPSFPISSIPPPRVPTAGSVPRGAQAQQLQLLLFRLKCLHLFIPKTPLRLPRSSASGARARGEETRERRLSAKRARLCPLQALRVLGPPAGSGPCLCIFGGLQSRAGCSRPRC